MNDGAINDNCCRKICEKALLLEGDLSGPEWDQVQHHLNLCPPCLEYVRQMGLTVDALRQLKGECPLGARVELLQRFEAWLEKRKSGC